MNGVGKGDDTVNPVLRAEHGVAGQSLEHGHRIGKPGGFNHHAVKIWNTASTPVAKQFSQRVLQIGSYRTAEAAIGQQTNAFRRHGNQVMVNADLTHFVDDNGHLVHRRMPEQAGNQGGLSAAQKTRNQAFRNFASQWVALHGFCHLSFSG